jgi:CBS domain-containing protein
MLREPKTLPATATVAEVRVLLDNPHVRMVLLADGRRFRGAITELPGDADPGAAALPFAEREPETLSPGDSAETAFARAARNPYRRIVVLDEDETLVGLLCLKLGGAAFCGASRVE